jgi:predicted negative regulator of RcsB-dependent stress response
MQTQDVPGEFLFKLWPWLEANRNRLIGALVVIVLISGVFYFVSAQRAQKQVDAGQAMTSLMMNPEASSSTQRATEFEQLAEKYSGTIAAQRAQLQAAGALFDAGSYPEAQALFQKFLDANPSGSLAATAELGIASSLEAQGKTDAAAGAYQRVISSNPDSSYLAPAELALGRIAEAQNRLSEAVTHYQNASRAAMGTSITQEANLRIAELQARVSAAAAAKQAVISTKPGTAGTKPTGTPPTAAPQPATKP